jgi:hypothetical protein
MQVITIAREELASYRRRRLIQCTEGNFSVQLPSPLCASRGEDMRGEKKTKFPLFWPHENIKQF